MKLMMKFCLCFHKITELWNLFSLVPVGIFFRCYFRQLFMYFSFKVPTIPEYFFRFTKSLHLLETHCAFLPLFNPKIDLLQAVKVTKSGHHLSHDRASKGYGSTPCLTSQTALHACLQRLNTMQISLWRQTRIRPMPLLARSCEKWWLDFITFTTWKKVKT